MTHSADVDISILD